MFDGLNIDPKKNLKLLIGKCISIVSCTEFDKKEPSSIQRTVRVILRLLYHAIINNTMLVFFNKSNTGTICDIIKEMKNANLSLDHCKLTVTEQEFETRKSLNDSANYEKRKKIVGMLIKAGITGPNNYTHDTVKNALYTF